MRVHKNHTHTYKHEHTNSIKNLAVVVRLPKLAMPPKAAKAAAGGAKKRVPGPSLTGALLKEGVWPRNSWRLGAFLGEGACSQVYEAILEPSNGGAAAAAAGGDGKQYVAKVSALPPAEATAAGKKRDPRAVAADVLFAEHALYRNNLKGHPQVCSAAVAVTCARIDRTRHGQFGTRIPRVCMLSDRVCTARTHAGSCDAAGRRLWR
jgi:hypothetical protein